MEAGLVRVENEQVMIFGSDGEWIGTLYWDDPWSYVNWEDFIFNSETISGTVV